MVGCGLNACGWLATGCRLLWIRQWAFQFHRRQDKSCLAEELRDLCYLIILQKWCMMWKIDLINIHGHKTSLKMACVWYNICIYVSMPTVTTTSGLYLRSWFFHLPADIYYISDNDRRYVNDKNKEFSTSTTDNEQTSKLHEAEVSWEPNSALN